MKANVIQGNAIDLSMYEDNTFDITLCLGPLYHLFKPEETKKQLMKQSVLLKGRENIFSIHII